MRFVNIPLQRGQKGKDDFGVSTLKKNGGENKTKRIFASFAEKERKNAKSTLAGNDRDREAPF